MRLSVIYLIRFSNIFSLGRFHDEAVGSSGEPEMGFLNDKGLIWLVTQSQSAAFLKFTPNFMVAVLRQGLPQNLDCPKG